MKRIFFVVFALSFTGCVLVDSGVKWELVFTNDTDYSIRIKGYKSGADNDDGNLTVNIFLRKGESATHYGFTETVMPLGNNLTVIYDDTLLVRHGAPVGVPKRNLYYSSSYKVTILEIAKHSIFYTPRETYTMRAEYVFTEEDYLEALELYRQEHP